MLNNYLIVERSALPDYLLKVLEARQLLESGECSQVSDAVRRTGVSRSTFYKYKDKIVEPSKLDIVHKATLMLTLTHEAGNLSRVLNALSAVSANILSISQSLPIRGTASIMLTLDTSKMETPVDNMLDALQRLGGVEKVRLLALE